MPSERRATGTSLQLALPAIFFASGAAALTFETLWFRQAALVLGSAVWSTSIVLGSFMLGLGLGNLIAAQRGSRLAQPIRAYAWLELTVATSGLAVALGLPLLGRWLAPFLEQTIEPGWPLQGVRLLVAFGVMVAPAVCMGATLPILVRALETSLGFGPALGRLYGWNTLGALAGVVASEWVLLPWLGVAGTAWSAAGLAAAAGAVAFRLSPRDPMASTTQPRPAARIAPASWSLLFAAGLCGFALLGLEVVGFRLILLSVNSSTAVFAVMLATVLAGIGLGGLAGGRWLRRQRAQRHAPALALLAAFCVVAGYAGLQGVQPLADAAAFNFPVYAAKLALVALFPTTVLSGLLFPLIGTALQDRLVSEIRSAGLLTLANTIGAAAGSLVAGLWLLPRLGVEASVFTLASCYVLVAALLLCADAPRWEARTAWLGLALAGAVLALAAFPFGLMRNHYLRLTAERWFPAGKAESRIVATREGLNETSIYLENFAWNQRVSYRLVTNAISMSGTSLSASRYMRLFVYLPAALREPLEDALLISYGVGVTAAALRDTPGLRRIDIVDISPEILELGCIPHPTHCPLRDPRVQVHVEDGRFFLAATNKEYDLITAEPPPPRSAGMATLYSREHFQLIRQRLRPHGLATYWLPVYQLTLAESKAVASAFCAAFSDCSLWSGSGFEWVLMGSRDGVQPVQSSTIERLWLDPRARSGLAEVGFEDPPQLFATFLLDADGLAQWVAGQPPVTDDRPYRLSSRETVDTTTVRAYFDVANLARARKAFADSRELQRMLPAELYRSTLEQLPEQEALLISTWRAYVAGEGASVEALERTLTRTSYRTAPLWAMATDAVFQQASAAWPGSPVPPSIIEERAIGAMAARDYARAADLFGQSRGTARSRAQLAAWRILALDLAGSRAAAQGALREALPLLRTRPADLRYLLWRLFGEPPPLLARDAPSRPALR